MLIGLNFFLVHNRNGVSGRGSSYIIGHFNNVKPNVMRFMDEL